MLTMKTMSAEAIGNNIDLLTEILVRLPVKPLGKFKCVSKQWLSLISDHQFSLSHTRHHLTPTALLLKKIYDPDPPADFEMVPLKPDIIIAKVPSFDFLNVTGFRIKQSCNGLLLLSSIKPLEPMFYICNPITKQFKRLCYPTPHILVCKVCMAFDPLKSSHYKLIYVCRVIKTDKHQIHMYSSETDSWSPLEITLTPTNGMKVYHAVFCNGAVHWYSTAKTSLYFDVDTQSLNTMPMPNLAHHNVLYFGESRSHLHLIVTESLSSSEFDVLEMAADCSGWFVRYHVNLDAVRIAFPDRYRFSVLDLIRAQKEEDSIVVVLVDKKAIFYNVHDGTSKMLHDLEYAVTKNYSSWETYRYFESLASV